jgi:hypothetical protein
MPPPVEGSDFVVGGTYAIEATAVDGVGNRITQRWAYTIPVPVEPPGPPATGYRLQCADVHGHPRLRIRPGRCDFQRFVHVHGVPTVKLVRVSGLRWSGWRTGSARARSRRCTGGKRHRRCVPVRVHAYAAEPACGESTYVYTRYTVRIGSRVRHLRSPGCLWAWWLPEPGSVAPARAG